MKKVLKIASLVLLMTMLCSLCVLAAEPIYRPIPVSVQKDGLVMLANQSNAYPVAITDTASVSQRITIKGEVIDSVTVLSPGYSDAIGYLTIRVYNWAGSYQATLDSDIIAEKKFENYADNSFLNVDIPNPTSGDILIHVCNGSSVGVWISRDLPQQITQTTYNGGVEGGCMLSGYTLYKEQPPMESYPEKNPYEFIANDTYEVMKGFECKVINDQTDEPAYGAFYTPQHGAYAGYFNVNFGDTAPKSATFRIYIQGMSNMGEVQLCLDSPTGPIIASVRFFSDPNYKVEWGGTGGGDFWTTLSTNTLIDVTGRHNIYYVCREGQHTSVLGKFKFNHEEVEPEGWDKEVLEYQPVDDKDLMWTYSDTWTATDILGRKLVDHSVVGDIREDKETVLFYWDFNALSGYKGQTPTNMQNVVDMYPGHIDEIRKNPNYIGWQGTHFWNESVYGYYTTFDTWVLRKQMELFSAAGIDAIATDCSNGASTFASGYMRLVREMHKMRQLGYNVPKITFLLPWAAHSDTNHDIESLYIAMYGSGLYSDCWYYWDGKPVLMGYPQDLERIKDNDDVNAFHQELREFFTYRPCQSAYKRGQTRENQWSWLEVYPQHGFTPTADGGYEMVSVGVAQNSNDEAESYCSMNDDGVYGRSYTYKDRFSKLSEDSVFYGYNFQEQWDHALEIDPQMIFITGWNEWHVGGFVDEWIDEYSRDIEPTKGQLQDTYYLQMVNNIRRFKGVSPTPVASEAKTIDLSASFSQWEGVGPEFIGYKGGTEPRDLRSFRNNYKNDTGRNDIVLSKVARDSDNLYFYVETAEDLTPSTDNHWMRLYINSDRTYKTGWEGYDYIINRVSPTSDALVVEKFVGKNNTWKWEKAGDATYTVSGNKMMISVPRSLVGVGENVDIEFKWHDNGVNDGDALDFYENGDCAPVGRYAYRYVEDLSKGVATADEPVDVANDINFVTRKMVILAIDDPIAYSKGHRKMIDPANPEVKPIIVNDKTLVPIRFISEGLGATVGWDEETSSATITLLGNVITIKEYSETMKVGDKTLTLQTPAQTINDRMYVPLRDVSEALGVDCYWEDPGLIVIGNHAIAKLLSNDFVVPGLLDRFGY